MQSHHWLMLAVAILAGYVLHAYFPAPGRSIGLPG